MKIDWKKWYDSLKAAEPEAYHKAIQYAEGLALNYNFSVELAAKVETAFVMLACELLHVKP